jgi:hypothetical protein
MTSNFNNIDSNTDGKITADEIQNLMNQMASQGLTREQIAALGASSGLSTSLQETVLNHFDQIDKNHDGKVTNQEIQAYGVESDLEKQKISDRNSNLFVMNTTSWANTGTWKSVVEETASYRFQQGSSENTLELELYLESDTYYSFKLNEGATWYGNMGLIQSETATPWVFETDGSTPNCRFIAEQTGYYRFIYNYGKKQVSVEFIGTSYN